MRRLSLLILATICVSSGCTPRPIDVPHETRSVLISNGVAATGWLDIPPDDWVELARESCAIGEWDEEQAQDLAERFAADIGRSEDSGAQGLIQLIWTNLRVLCPEATLIGDAPSFVESG